MREDGGTGERRGGSPPRPEDPHGPADIGGGGEGGTGADGRGGPPPRPEDPHGPADTAGEGEGGTGADGRGGPPPRPEDPHGPADTAGEGDGATGADGRGGPPPRPEDPHGPADIGGGGDGGTGAGGAEGADPSGGADGRGGLREALLGLLGGAERQDGGPSAADLADVLWMARLAGLGPPDAGSADAGEPRGDGPGQPVTPPRPRDVRDRGAAGPPAPRPPASRRPDAGPPAASGRAPEPKVGLHPMRPDAGPETAGSGAGHVVRVTRPPALTGTLDLARALRPLRQSVDSPGSALLDEEATAQATGEAAIGRPADAGARLMPVWRPASERRFRLDLLVDTGATMAVWHGLAAELCTVLERHGAFAGVRCWSLDTDRPVPRLSAFRRRHAEAEPAKALRWPGPLEDPSGRRVLLVLTDGVGPAWYGDRLPDFLARVAAERPAAALQVLPRRLWHRTALRAFPVELRVPDAARPVPEVRPQVPLPGHLRPAGTTSAAGPGDTPAPRAPGPTYPTTYPTAAGTGGPPPLSPPTPERLVKPSPVRWLPVMEVDGRWLAPWAGLIAGRVAGWAPMLAAPVRGVARPRRSPAAAPPADAGERVARFRAGCSPRAFRLACHLAAAPLSLPVMRLVQQATMPGSGQTDLAEVFLSGIVERRGGAAGPADPDEVVYDFVPGVREELLAELTRTESLHVLEDVLAKVSGRVAATFGGTLDFRALAAPANGAGGAAGDQGAANGPRTGPALPPGRHLPETSLPFTEVAVAVLSGAGGHHRALAERLAAAAGARIPLPEGMAPAPAPRTPETGTPAPGRPPARTPAVPRPDLLNPVLPVPTRRGEPEPMAGGARLLDMLGAALAPGAGPPGDPAGAEAQDLSAVAVLQGPPGSGRRRLVKEYVARYGARHSLVHVIDATSESAMRRGVAALRAALAGDPDRAPWRGTWHLLADHPGWLLVYEGLPPDRDPRDFDPLIPWFGRGSVVITTESAAEGRLHENFAVLTLGPLSPSEIADYLLAHAAPGLLDRDPDAERRIRELARRLPVMPDELTRMDVRLLFARELGLRANRPKPLDQWWRPTGSEHHLAGLAANGSTWVADSDEVAPVRLNRWVWPPDHQGKPVQGPAAPGAALPHSGRVTSLAALRDESGAPSIAVADGSREVTVYDLGTRGRRSTVTSAIAGAEDRAIEGLAAFTGPDGVDVLVTFGQAVPVRLWRAGRLKMDGPPTSRLRRCVALTFFTAADGGWYGLAVTASGSVALLDAATFEELPLPPWLTGMPADAVSLATVPGRDRSDVLVALGRDGAIRLWEVAGANRRCLLTADPSRFTAVAGFTAPDGRGLLATASKGDDLKQLWDVRALLAELAGPERPDGGTAPGTRSGRPRPGTPEPGPAGAYAPELRWQGDDLLWLVSRLADGPNGVSREALSLLAPHDQESVGRHIASGRLSRLPDGRLSRSRTEDVALNGTHERACESRLLGILGLVCPEPTADPATWVPYRVLEEGARPLPTVVLGLTYRSAAEEAAGRARAVLTRWIAYLLVRGRYDEAGGVLREAESSPALFGDVRYTDARARLSMAHLRVRTARGDVVGSRLVWNEILHGEPAESPRAAAAVLARARLSLLTGDLAAAQVESRAAEGAAAADRGLALRLLEERIRQRLTGGDLSGAARHLSQMRGLVGMPADGADAASLTEARLAQGRHALLMAEVALVVDDLTGEPGMAPAGPGDPGGAEAGALRSAAGPRGPAGRDPAPLVPDTPVNTVSVVQMARWRMWQTPDGRPESPAELLASVPAEYAEVFAELTERYVEALLVRETGGLWHASGGGPYSAPLAVMRTLNELDERLATRRRRADLLSRRMTVEGRLALAGGRFGRAASVLETAREAVTDAYGRNSPLLPRILLHLALAWFLDGSPRHARDAVDEAQDLLNRLHGSSTPHQDRVTALMARSRLARRPQEAQDAQARLAAAMRHELLRSLPET
ncbi:SAV_2336 N-terminal domain-related protein [Streptomyces sp. HPF1205]|uniref:SAV_2336 N-terminal domain-related protein n=1 Tax=Streptomyces sp. HPF1205 TaxID=2873262 RepID=UPI0021F22C5E|nr:SAV_2336 N-terminal domain-related protein [Streptomyces sp. HPF1205]